MKKVKFIPKVNLTPKMKKVVTTVLTLISVSVIMIGSFILGFCCARKTNDTYTISAYVSEINNDEIFFETENEHYFVITSTEQFAVGEKYEITFSTENTQTIEDDVILIVNRTVVII